MPDMSMPVQQPPMPQGIPPQQQQGPPPAPLQQGAPPTQQGPSPAQKQQQVDNIEQGITQMRDHGFSDSRIVDTLSKEPFVSATIQGAIAKGYSVGDIVTRLGGQPLAQQEAANAKVNSQSFLTNVGQGVSNAVGDIGNAGQQLATRMVAGGLPAAEGGGLQDTDQEMQTRAGANQQLVQQQATQAAAEAAPERQALDRTVGGNVGNVATKAVPYAAAAALAPEGAIPAIATQGLAGALSGALTPTTGPGQLGKNIAVDATLGAGTQGAGSLIAKGGGALATALSNSVKDTGAITDMTAAGLTPTMGTVNPLVRALASKVPEAMDKITTAGQKDIAQAALKQVGVNGSDLSLTNLNAAKTAIWKPANDVIASVGPIPPTPAFTTSLAKIGSDYADNALSSSVNPKVASTIQGLIDKSSGGLLTGTRALDYLRDVKDLAGNADNMADRTAFKAIGSTLSDTLSAASSDGGAALARANALHSKLLVLRDVADRAQAGQLPTIQNWNTSNGLSKFTNEAGEGPFHDLITAANKAYSATPGTTGRWAGPASMLTQHLPSVVGAIGGAATGGLDSGIGGYVAGGAVQKGLAKALSAVVNRPVSATVRQATKSNPALRTALQSVMVGGGQAGVQSVANPQQ